MLKDIIQRDTLSKEDLNEMDDKGHTPIHHFAPILRSLYSQNYSKILNMVKMKLVLGKWNEIDNFTNDDIFNEMTQQ